MQPRVFNKHAGIAAIAAIVAIVAARAVVVSLGVIAAALAGNIVLRQNDAKSDSNCY
jgi:hypothetical protein